MSNYFTVTRTPLLGLLLLNAACSGRSVNLDDTTQAATADPTVFVGNEGVDRVWADGMRLFWQTARWGLQECDVGSCAATTRLVDDTSWPQKLAFGGERTYWMSGGTIRTYPQGDREALPLDFMRGALSVATSSPPNPYSRGWEELTSDANYVCWADHLAAYCCPSSGCNGAPELAVLARVSGLQLRDQYLYWTTSSELSTTGWRAPMGNLAAPTQLSLREGWGHSVLVGSNNLIYSDGLQFRTCPLEGCPKDPRAIVGHPDENLLSDMSTDDVDLYWLQASDINDPHKHLMRCPLTGCDQAESVLPDNARATQYALGPDHIYWVDVPTIEYWGPTIEDTLPETPPSYIHRIPK